MVNTRKRELTHRYCIFKIINKSWSTTPMFHVSEGLLLKMTILISGSSFSQYHSSTQNTLFTQSAQASYIILTNNFSTPHHTITGTLVVSAQDKTTTIQKNKNRYHKHSSDTTRYNTSTTKTLSHTMGTILERMF